MSCARFQQPHANLTGCNARHSTTDIHTAEMEYDRLVIRRHIRHQMRARGLLQFCDDADAEEVDAEGQRLNRDQTGQTWAAERRSYDKHDALIQVGILASSTDHVMQNIQNTISSDSEFWSSTGTQNRHSCEGLLYALRSSACCVQHVVMSIYRAQYQHGDPLYPPEAVSFYVGPSPSQLYPASPVYPCSRTDHLQVFPLFCSAPPGGYLLLKLHGKLQQQWEDMSYYLAIRYVAAYGVSLGDHEVPELLHGLHARAPTWSTCAGAHRRIQPSDGSPLCLISDASVLGADGVESQLASEERSTSGRVVRTSAPGSQGQAGSSSTGYAVFQANEGKQLASESQPSKQQDQQQEEEEEQQEVCAMLHGPAASMMLPHLHRDVPAAERRLRLASGNPWWTASWQQVADRGMLDADSQAQQIITALKQAPGPAGSAAHPGTHVRHASNALQHVARIVGMGARLLSGWHHGGSRGAPDQPASLQPAAEEVKQLQQLVDSEADAPAADVMDQDSHMTDAQPPSPHDPSQTNASASTHDPASPRAILYPYGKQQLYTDEPLAPAASSAHVVTRVSGAGWSTDPALFQAVLPGAGLISCRSQVAASWAVYEYDIEANDSFC